MKNLLKRLLTVTLGVMILCTVCVGLAGCDLPAINPYKYEQWHLQALLIDGKWLEKTDSDVNKLVFGKDYNDYWYGRLFSDSVTFMFKRNKTFEMKTLDGEVKRGSYKHEKLKDEYSAKYTHILMDFDDGTKGEGRMTERLLTGGASGTISVGNISYAIFPGSTSDRLHWQEVIETEQATFKTFLASNIDHIPFKSHINGMIYTNIFYCKGTFIKEDGKYYFINSYSGAKTSIPEFLERGSLYTLTTDGEFTAIPIPNTFPAEGFPVIAMCQIDPQQESLGFQIYLIP